MDVRTVDGSVVKISAGNEQDLAKTLGVEMVQNMYKVRNILKTTNVTIVSESIKNVAFVFRYSVG